MAKIVEILFLLILKMEFSNQSKLDIYCSNKFTTLNCPNKFDDDVLFENSILFLNLSTKNEDILQCLNEQFSPQFLHIKECTREINVDEECNQTHFIESRDLFPFTLVCVNNIENSDKRDKNNVLPKTSNNLLELILSNLKSPEKLRLLSINNLFLTLRGNFLQNFTNLEYFSLTNVNISEISTRKRVDGNYFIQFDFSPSSGIEKSESFDLFQIELKYLKLSYNQIQTLGECGINRTFSFLTALPFLNYLDFSHNYISRICYNFFYPSFNLQVLNLQHNEITTLDNVFVSNLNKLLQLDLSNNKLEIICKSDFLFLKSLEKLDLSSNRIYKIDELAFSNLKNLKILLLDNNFLHLTEKSVLYFSSSNINLLSLSNNFIQNIFNFKGNNLKITHLDLSANRLKYFRLDDFPRQSTYEKVTNFIAEMVNLENNEITAIDFEETTNDHTLVDKLETTVFKINKNPLTCDCNTKNLHKYINLKLNYKNCHYVLFEGNELYCHKPNSLHNHLFKDVKREFLRCDNTKYCPINCTCIYLLNELKVNCKNNYNNIPANTTELMLSFNLFTLKNLNQLQMLRELKLENCPNLQNIFHNESSPFMSLNRLNSLSLEENSLTSLSELNFKGLANLSYLKVSNNLLKFFNLSALVNLREIFLDGNAIFNISENSFENNLKLEKIYVQKNGLTSIKFITSRLEKLIFIDASNNFLYSADINWPENVEEIILSKNSIRNINFSTFPKKLRYLDLSYNSLGTLNIDTFSHFTQRSIFNFNYNKISNFQSYLTQVKFNNDLNFQNKIILLNYNPIDCTCMNRILFEYLEKSRIYFSTLVIFEVENLYCGDPEFQQNKPVVNLNVPELPCEEQNCAVNCVCYKQYSSSYRIAQCFDFPKNEFEHNINELYMHKHSQKKIHSFTPTWVHKIVIVKSTLDCGVVLQDGLFVGMNNLTEITIIGHDMLKFSNLVFSNLSKLVHLDLSHNGITELQNHTFDGSCQLQYLDLSYNLIESLPNDLFVQLKHLQVLNVSENRISHLFKNLFENLTNLTALYLKNNQLSFLESNLLIHCIRLQEIDLSNNSLTNNNLKSLFIPFSLIFLNISGNQITNIEKNWLKLPKLEKLDLTNNEIQVLQAPLLNFSNSVEILLSNNNISQFEWFQQKKPTPRTISNLFNNRFTFLTLSNNPFTCDCNLHYLIQFLHKPNGIPLKIPDANQLFCSQPIGLRNKLLINVKDNDLYCKLEDCPSYCNCVHRSNVERNIVHCNESGIMTKVLTCPKEIDTLRLTNLDNVNYLNHGCWRFLKGLSITNSVLNGTISADVLKNHKNLLELNLSENNLKFVPSNLFVYTPEILAVDFSKNRLTSLPPELFCVLKNIKTIDLSRNFLKNITWQIPLTVEHLNLAENKIEFINVPQLSYDYQLKFLNLSQNLLRAISTNEQNFLFRMNNLKLLDLSYNNIFINCSNTTSIFPPSLLSLNISHNKLHCTHFWNNSISTSKLQKLDLSNNPIGSLQLLDFVYVNNSGMIIDIENCEINNYSLSISSRIKLDKNSLLSVNMRGNPLVECDCDIIQYQTVKSLQKNNQFLHLQIISSNSCIVNNLKLKSDIRSNFDFSPNTTFCQVRANCPVHCTCLEVPEVNAVWMYCNYQLLISIPSISPSNVQYLNLDYNNITYLEGLNNSRWKNLIVVSLRNNNINSIGMENLATLFSLRAIYLEGNQLEKPSGWLKNFVEKNILPFNITLSNNPWSCKCDNLIFQNWVINFAKSQLILDRWNISCNNGDLLLNYEMCPLSQVDIWKILLPILITFCLVLTFMLLMLNYYRKKLTVLSWIYSKNLCRCFVNEDDLDVDKLYDAFISYCEEDSDFLKELLSGLEDNEPFYKICVHERDWILGELILDQIEKSVKNSRRVIIVVSRDYTKSAWANVEFKFAYYQSIQDRVNRVIVVVLDEDFSTDELADEFRAYLNMVTYLKVSDSQFWNKLRYAMPHKKQEKRDSSTLQLVGIEEWT